MERFEHDEVIDGVPHRFDIQLIPDIAPDGGVRGFFYTGLDITERADAERALRELTLQAQSQSDVLRLVTEAIPATVVVMGADGRYRFANGAFERYCGVPRDRIVGHTAIEVLGAEEVARRPPWMLRAFAGESVTFTLDDAGPEGTTWLELSCIPLLLGGEGVDGFVGVVTDITSQRREQDRLTALSQRDPLTGLLNRAGFEQFLERQAQAGLGATLGLLYVDLDHSVRAWAWRSASRPWRAGTSRSTARTRRSIERGRPVADAIRARARQVRPPVAWAASPGHATPSCPAVRRTARGSARPPCAGPPCWLRHAGRARRCAAPRGSC